MTDCPRVYYCVSGGLVDATLMRICSEFVKKVDPTKDISHLLPHTGKINVVFETGEQNLAKRLKLSVNTKRKNVKF